MSAREQNFSRKYRLADSSDFTAVFKSTKRLADGNFLVLYRRNDLDIARLGIAVSRKSVRLASTRNEIKRLTREGFRRCKHELKGLDVVVIAKRTIKTGNRSIIARSLAAHWDRLKSA